MIWFQLTCFPLEEQEHFNCVLLILEIISVDGAWSKEGTFCLHSVEQFCIQFLGLGD